MHVDRLRFGLGSSLMLASALCAVAALPAAAQPQPEGSSRVLSTAATPQPGTNPAEIPMSGLPLPVGDLPPGTLAVRVVRHPFANIVGQAVQLHVGSEGHSLNGVTGADGRATFSGLNVGEFVMAVAEVDGERLESQLFQVPTQGGVRVLLAATSPGASPITAQSPPHGTVPALPHASGQLSGNTHPAAFVLAALFAFGALGLLVVGWRHR